MNGRWLHNPRSAAGQSEGGGSEPQARVCREKPSPAREREGPAPQAWEGEGGGTEPQARVGRANPSPAREREGPAPQAWEGEGDHPHDLERSTGRARRLRRDSTPAERQLWAALRGRRLDGWRFQRQVPIAPFFADFACSAARLIIEVDGSQHQADRAKDEARSQFPATKGYRVLRFWNSEVLSDIDGVQRQILAALTLPPLRGGPLPLPGGRGEDGARK